MTFTLAIGDYGQHLAQHKPLRSNFGGIGRRTWAGHISGQELVKSWGLEPKDLETDRREIEREINMSTLILPILGGGIPASTPGPFLRTQLPRDIL